MKSHGKGSHKQRAGPGAKSGSKSGSERSGPMLDLHGYTVDEVASAVDQFLVKCQKLNVDRAWIMTGKGEGKVRKATSDYLKLGGFPFSVERLASGASNDGVLVIHLD
jgi:DNA-nicking Smr family endonuclease